MWAREAKENKNQNRKTKQKAPPTKTVGKKKKRKREGKQPRKLLSICQSKQSVWGVPGVCPAGRRQAAWSNVRGSDGRDSGAPAGRPDCEPQDTPSAMQNRTYLSGLLVLSAETKQSHSQREAKSK